MVRKFLSKIPFGKKLIENIESGDQLIMSHSPLEIQVKHFIKGIPYLIGFSVCLAIIIFVLYVVIEWLKPFFEELFGILSVVLILFLLYICGRNEKHTNVETMSSMTEYEWLELATNVVQPVVHLKTELLEENGKNLGMYYCFSIRELANTDEIELKVILRRLEKKWSSYYCLELKCLRELQKTQKIIIVNTESILIKPRAFV